jgi:hypothetical protein
MVDFDMSLFVEIPRAAAHRNSNTSVKIITTERNGNTSSRVSIGNTLAAELGFKKGDYFKLLRHSEKPDVIMMEKVGVPSLERNVFKLSSSKTGSQLYFTKSSLVNKAHKSRKAVVLSQVTGRLVFSI